MQSFLYSLPTYDDSNASNSQYGSQNCIQSQDSPSYDNSSDDDSAYLGQQHKQDSNNYEVRKLISESKYSVYQALDTNTYQTVAVKVFPHAEKNGKKLDPNFENERKFIGSSHPNVISMIEEQEICTIPELDGEYSAVIMEFASYGDFIDVIPKIGMPNDEVLARTFFHHLVEGLEYLHSNGLAHLDLKAENLLLGDDFQLKITDFDMSSEIGSGVTHGKGTENFRAPEFIFDNCKDFVAADVYSVGILLFVFKYGHFPYVEKNFIKDKSLHDLLLTNANAFWEHHLLIGGDRMKASDDFKTLFEGMTHPVAQFRWSLKQVKASKWYNGPIYNDDVLRSGLSEIFNAATDDNDSNIEWSIFFF